RGLHRPRRRTCTQHLQDRLAAYEVNQRKDDGDDEPNSGKRVQHAKREIAQHLISQKDNLTIEAQRKRIQRCEGSQEKLRARSLALQLARYNHSTRRFSLAKQHCTARIVKLI